MSFETITLVITMAATLFAALSAGASLMQTILTKREFDRRERPYITGHFYGSHQGGIYFSLENRGNAPAIGVSARFDPAPEMHNGISLNDVSLFQNPIALFPPGASYRQLVALGKQMFADGKPLSFTLSVNYRATSGKRFEEQFHYNLDYLKGVLRPLPTVEESMQKTADYLEKIHQLMNKERMDRMAQSFVDEEGEEG